MVPLKADKEVQAQPPVSHTDDTMFPLIAEFSVAWMRDFLQQYPLLKRTPLLAKLLTMESTVANSDELLQLFECILNAKFENLFHRILMHQKIQYAEFKERIKHIQDLTAELNTHVKSNEDLKVVVFIDEFNTTSIMGILKEIFVDHSIDGEQLPSNVSSKPLDDIH